MGCNIFEKAEVTDKSPMFYIVENGILAKGIYNDGGMTVLEGRASSTIFLPNWQKQRKKMDN